VPPSASAAPRRAAVSATQTKEKEYIRSLRPSVWLTEQFPLKTEELLPLLDILANKVKAVRRMRELLTTKFPPGTFPVKVRAFWGNGNIWAYPGCCLFVGPFLSLFAFVFGSFDGQQATVSHSHLWRTLCGDVELLDTSLILIRR
jgi:hypothetical protein